MNVEELLHDEIKQEFDRLKEMEVGTDTYKTTVDGLTKLVDRAIEIDKVNIDHEQNEKAREDEKKDRFIRNVLTGLGIAVPTITTIWGTLKSFKFEETGTVTTIMGRGFINKLLPKK
jgi:hypothetical protein